MRRQPEDDGNLIEGVIYALAIVAVFYAVLVALFVEVTP